MYDRTLTQNVNNIVGEVEWCLLSGWIWFNFALQAKLKIMPNLVHGQVIINKQCA